MLTHHEYNQCPYVKAAASNTVPAVLRIVAHVVKQSLLHHRVAFGFEFVARFPFGKFVGVGDLVTDFE
jgi:hypothetical protein